MHLSWKPRTPVVTRASSIPMLRLWVLGPGFSPLGNCCFVYIYIYIYFLNLKKKFNLNLAREGQVVHTPTLFKKLKGQILEEVYRFERWTQKRSFS